MPKKKNSNKKASSSGKGDGPRSCFSQSYRDNYNEIDWGHDEESGEGGEKSKKIKNFKKKY